MTCLIGKECECNHKLAFNSIMCCDVGIRRDLHRNTMQRPSRRGGGVGGDQAAESDGASEASEASDLAALGYLTPRGRALDEQEEPTGAGAAGKPEGAGGNAGRSGAHRAGSDIPTGHARECDGDGLRVCVCVCIFLPCWTL